MNLDAFRRELRKTTDRDLADAVDRNLDALSTLRRGGRLPDIDGQSELTPEFICDTLTALTDEMERRRRVRSVNAAGATLR